MLPLTNVANCRQLYFFYLALTEEKIIEIVKVENFNLIVMSSMGLDIDETHAVKVQIRK
jgi:hypothetical protein